MKNLVLARPAAVRRLTSHGRSIDKLTKAAGSALVALALLGVLGLSPILGDSGALAGRPLQPPSLAVPFGADELGRSLLPRVSEGIRNTMVVAVVAVSLSTLFATVLGSAAGLFRGTLDRLAVATTNILLSFPTVLLAILVAAALGPGERATITSLLFVTYPMMLRVVRQSVIAIARRDFVISAEISGVPVWRVIIRHIIPNVIGPIVVQATIALSVAMLVESGLSFLGLGIQPPAASMGSLVAHGLEYIRPAPWLVMIPGSLLVLAIASANLIGDGFRDVLH